MNKEKYLNILLTDSDTYGIVKDIRISLKRPGVFSIMGYDSSELIYVHTANGYTELRDKIKRLREML